MVILVIAAGVVLAGIDPIKLVQYVIVFSVIPLPLTYFPILVTAENKNIMGPYKNGRLMNVLGWIFFTLTTVAAAAAIPLLIVTHGGQG